ncbi:YqaA family protein [Desulfobotulus mexicanus]|uniref:DedA family protein n=1 Tax=Desulfobotulus mexicanus TaxID=2586642 RepID=A0A5Q4VGL6_9BACT|nr:YqaA family protein [Desulfobotulus mexicanus]TYT75290.1 DedA family protein [Desulfobotulus mexicanus]
MLRRLYNWVLSWADSPWGVLALFIIAFAESSFFPIPPDILLIALCVGRPSRAFFYAGVCTAGSVLGGIAGYGIGWFFMGSIGAPIVAFYGAEEQVARIGELYNNYDAWAVAIAGFSPIPYKVFTIAAGMFAISLPVFITASVFSRAARFFLVAVLIWKFGPGIRAFIERYFDRLAILFVILLIGGFLLIRFVG